MRRDVSLPVPVRFPAERRGSWASLVGTAWPVYVRVLHPAWRVASADDPTDGSSDGVVTWSDLKPRGTDLAMAGWRDVSGARLHRPLSGPAWLAEPLVGPPIEDGTWSQMASRALEFTGDEFTEDQGVWVGQWTGYADHEEERDASLVEVRWPVKREYSVSRLTAGQLLARAESGGRRPFYPNLVWDEGETFCMASDVDLPSTVVGCIRSVGARLLADPELECVTIHGDQAIVV
ncbi:MAG: hypothetical protein Q4G67_05815 [Actinomycetia bacterium]|nr:hypothetical protein [Actinomycetes bacterium]